MLFHDLEDFCVQPLLFLMNHFGQKKIFVGCYFLEFLDGI